MKTYPITRPDGSMRGFEIGLTFTSLRRITEILRSADGVSGIRPTAGTDDRLMFVYGGETCVVHEPFGDNSRYWIGPAFPESSTLDIRPIEQVFAHSDSVLQKVMKAIGVRQNGGAS
jgi:hypothetical protein